MRTNKACPLYTGGDEDGVPQVKTEPPEDADLIPLGAIKTEDGLPAAPAKRRRPPHCDYLEPPNKPANRRTIHPLITLTSTLEEILQQMKMVPGAEPFCVPVDLKLVPDYMSKVDRPMDLGTMRQKLRERKYKTREEFLTDTSQILDNCQKYNGTDHELTVRARTILNLCISSMAQQEQKFITLEKAINPLLDDNDQVAFDYILDTVLEDKLKASHNSRPFLKPLSGKMLKDFMEVVKQPPMDLCAISKRVKNHEYHSRIHFMSDIQLLVSNSEAYYGKNSPEALKVSALAGISDCFW